MRYEFWPRGTIEVKGKGPMNPYLLLGRRDERQTREVAVGASGESTVFDFRRR
jgi:hypothetical protein